MSAYIPTIGLEIHAELKTRTKMFCNSKNDADEERPNYNVCPICLAHPGTLPVINKEAVRHVLRVGKALGGRQADYTEFDRKNYFYPDLPKGYQISQYEFPLISGGSLNGVQITRIHLEEDTASSIHLSTSLEAGDEASGATVIDYNRAGVPLMELVTEPVIKSAEQAGNFARELQLILRYLGISEANMEKGEMRVEANISLREIADERQENADTAVENLRQSAGVLRSSAALGTKVEIKNLNSFRIMEKAVAYEIKRQQELLERGEKVMQETRGWDEKAGKTFPQRVKEGSADYRYFPDPDLPSLNLTLIPDFSAESLEREMPELPSERRERYLGLGIKAEDAELYVGDSRLGAFFEAVVIHYEPSSRELILASNYIANDLVSIISSLASASAPAKGGSASGGKGNRGSASGGKATKDRRISRFRGLARDMEERDSERQPEIPISAEYFRHIIEMISSSRISSRSAKDILHYAVSSGEDPEEIARNKGLFQTSGVKDVEAIIIGVIEKNPRVVSDYKLGKAASLEYLIGQCMKVSHGAADPVRIRELLLLKLS